MQHARDFQDDFGSPVGNDVVVYVFSFRVYVRDPRDCYCLLARIDVGRTLYYIRFSQHAVHVIAGERDLFGCNAFHFRGKVRAGDELRAGHFGSGRGDELSVGGLVIRNFQVDMLHPETWVYFTPPFYFVALTTIVKQSSIPALILALSGIARGCAARFYHGGLFGSLFFGEDGKN